MNPKKLRKLLLFSLPILLITLYGGGYLGQFIANYTRWQSEGHAPGDGTFPPFLSPPLAPPPSA